MDISSIITQFSVEESASFKAYLRKKNKRGDTKNSALFSLLRKGTPRKEIDTILYGVPNRNAYHALSKRLQDSLIDFIASRNFETETSEDMQVFKWILAARILYEQGQSRAAHKILQKATAQAKELDLHTALVESYHTQLQYSHLHPEQDLNDLTKDALDNQQRFIQQERLNMAYAHIKKALIFDEHLLKKGFQKTVEEILASFKIEINETFSFKSLFQLLEIINTAAHLDHNFRAALPFITSTYSLVKKKKTVQIKQRFYHIQVLYYMANAHFRVRDFDKAHTYLTLMQHEMKADKGRWESRFCENYLLIHSFILNYTGQGLEAITKITTYLETRKKQTLDPDIALALVVFLTQQEAYKKAHTALNLLKHSDRWYEERYGKDWVIKKDLITLLIYLELEYIDLVDMSLRRFKRNHKEIIKSEVRLERFLKVFTTIYKEPSVVKNLAFRKSVKNQFTITMLKEEDLFMVSFFAWIKAKIDRTPLYITTLKLL